MRVLGPIVRAGFVAALVVAGAGWALELMRFGPTDLAAATRVEAAVQDDVNASAASLDAMAARAATHRDAILAARRDPSASARLFDLLDQIVADDSSGHTGITIFDEAEAPIAWAGRVSDPPARLATPRAALSLAASAFGPRLLRTEALVEPTRRAGARLATIVAERLLDPLESPPTLGDRAVLTTPLAPVTLLLGGALPPAGALVFPVTAPDGAPLVRAAVAPADLAQSRARWQHRTKAAWVSVLAVTLLCCAAPLVERRRHARRPRASLGLAAGIAGLLLSSRIMFRFAAMPVQAAPSLVGPLNLLLTSLVAAALVWLLIDILETARLTAPRARLLPQGPASIALVGLTYLAIGLLDAVLLSLYGRFLRAVVGRTTVDILHFSLHPLDPARLGLAFGFVILHAAVIWTAVAIARAPRVWWRTPAGILRRVTAEGWTAGALLGAAAMARTPAALPAGPQLVALAAVGACAAAFSAKWCRARRASQAARLGGLFLALLVPAVAMYPSFAAFAVAIKEGTIATASGPQAARLRDDLQARLRTTRAQIDNHPGLAHFVEPRAGFETPTVDRGFLVWSQTDLGKYRLTSAVELYGQDGNLVSRFALNLPEYTPGSFHATSCSWDLADVVSPIGATQSHVLRASRGICDAGRVVGGIVVRAMLDYRSLPFISSQSPYLQSLRPERQLPGEGVSGRDVEFAVYGWSRLPLFASGTSVWTLSDDVFERATETRAPFWDSVDRNGERFRVYILNDRAGIYALGYPVLTLFGHLINLAELATLVLALFVVLIAWSTLFNALTSPGPASAQALLREVRSSFYRKLFLAFWAAAVLPVVLMAFAIRTYFAGELTAGIEDAAIKTVTVAQRLVEDYATLQQRGEGTLAVLDDEIMVLVSRAIDEDVDLFDRARLQATSERDLFASRLLATRTPAPVYRKLVLERAPTYVGVQQVGTVRYYIAAAPVRTGGRDGVVTVPVALRQQEIERQIDELDRRVLFGAVLLSLFGGAFGYWMAERIADPVNRLTRATRRIARGDLNVRIALTSSDELRRLVEDFNQMAADLTEQRAAFERTKRLEAWADMARQVAHDIKNPLTPIQLSAEHARRVNIDHGRPLSPVLDECVTAILGQVRLLRQIATEFSNFASSPTPHPAPTAVADLVEEVVVPYRAGLADRIAIDVVTAPNLPTLSIDRTLFARALTNVLENALHAMPGTGRVAITVATRLDAAPGPDTPSRPSVVVEVTDTGVGMDEEALAKIFEPYFSTKATGTGLGLTIAKRNVELNGGTIHVKSTRGIGTTVTINLPLPNLPLPPAA